MGSPSPDCSIFGFFRVSVLQAKSKPKGIFCVLMRGEISNFSYCNFIIITVVCVIVYLAIPELCFMFILCNPHDHNFVSEVGTKGRNLFILWYLKFISVTFINSLPISFTTKRTSIRNRTQ
jgi:hypothetical protein